MTDEQLDAFRTMLSEAHTKGHIDLGANNIARTMASMADRILELEDALAASSARESAAVAAHDKRVREAALRDFKLYLAVNHDHSIASKGRDPSKYVSRYSTCSGVLSDYELRTPSALIDAGGAA